jgi:hypothetical protein
VTTFYCFRFETPQSGGLGPRIYIPQKQGGSVITPGIGFHFRRLLQLAGLRCRYSTPPPHGIASSPFTTYWALFLSALWGYWHCGHSWPIVPASGDSEDDCGEADGMQIGRGKPKFSKKTCPSATFVHHKIPHDQTQVWTRAAAVGSRRLTAWAVVRIEHLIRHGPHTTHRAQQFFYYCMCIRFRRNVFIEPLPNNDCLFWIHYSGFQVL